MYLMCKNNVVFDIEKEVVYSEQLLPGCMKSSPCKETFNKWLKLRYSEDTNTIARQLKGVQFGQGNRAVINKETYMLSLSDCYWLKENDNHISFYKVSPYCVDFWKGYEPYVSGTAVPTLYTNGALTKEWLSSDYLYKYGDNVEIEVEVSKLCKACDVPVCEIESVNIEGVKCGIKVKNFTSPTSMLEQADQSGKIDTDNFTEKDIIELFGISGVQMLTIDAIIGNGDRHAGNFGWLRDTITGVYLRQAPLYDFDHALDSISERDRLITDLVSVVKNDKDYANECIRICGIVKQLVTNIVFIKRAESILNLMK